MPAALVPVVAPTVTPVDATVPDTVTLLFWSISGNAFWARAGPAAAGTPRAAETRSKARRVRVALVFWRIVAGGYDEPAQLKTDWSAVEASNAATPVVANRCVRIAPPPSLRQSPVSASRDIPVALFAKRQIQKMNVKVPEALSTVIATCLAGLGRGRNAPGQMRSLQPFVSQ